MSDEPSEGSHDAELRDLFGDSNHSSSDSGPDGELQRRLMTTRLFGGAPVTIGRFVVETLLGVGGSAAVYAARDPLLDRRVALKVMARPSEEKRAAVVDRVMREARALAKLSHRNVVSIYEFGEWEGRPFIAMELIEGRTLAQWLADEPRLRAQIIEVFLEAGLGLAAAHARGRVHRDFKPANVLVADDGRVVVTDFGLADDICDAPPFAKGSLTCVPTTAAASTSSAASSSESSSSPSSDEQPPLEPGPILGTPAYAAPEQRCGVAAHPSADVYSFAIALIEALLGYHPTPTSPVIPLELPQGASLDHAALRLEWYAALRKKAPRRLFRALCAAAQPEPWRRALSLEPLLEALRECTPRRVHARRRARWLVGGSALLVLLAVVVLIPYRGRAPASPVIELRRIPVVLAEQRDSLLATPLAERGERWRSDAAALIMLPVPAEVPCNWKARPRDFVALGERMVALDEHGDVYSCDLRNGIVAEAPLGRGVDCLRSDERNVVELLGATSESRLTSAPRGWQLAGAGSFITRRDVSFRGLDGLCHAYPLEARRGERRVTVEGGTLWYQRGAQPPRRLVDRVVQIRVDEQVRYALATTSVFTVFDLDRDLALRAPMAPIGNAGARYEMAPDGGLVVGSTLDGPIWWWRPGDEEWHALVLAQRVIKGLWIGPGARLAVITDNGQLQVVELVSGRRYLLADAQMRQAHFLDEDHVVAADISGRIWRWSLSAQRTSVLTEHPGTGVLWGTQISPDGSVVASSSGGKGATAIRLSSLGEGADRQPEVSLSVPPGTGIHALTFDGDRLIAGTSDSVLRSWDWRTLRSLGETALPAAEWIWTVVTARRPDGSRVDVIGMGRMTGGTIPGLVGDESRDLREGGRVYLLDAQGPIARFDAIPSGNTGISSLDVSPDGRLAVATTSAGELAVIDLTSGTAASLAAHTGGEARFARFFDGGRRVASVGDDGILLTWKVTPSAAPALPPVLQQLRKIFINHGRIFELKIFKGATGEVALLGSDDGDLSLRDLATGEELVSYRGHTAGITALDLDVAHRRLVSADYQGRLCLRLLDRPDCVIPLYGHDRAAIRNARFLPDGRLVTSSDDRTVRLWAPRYAASSDELGRELARLAFTPAP